uniref:Protein kinase domain-containing protein n=1 Tax=Macrostomum lignano TaxID=282301 RepID=A0A1I8FLW7_9PLAT
LMIFVMSTEMSQLTFCSDGCTMNAASPRKIRKTHFILSVGKEYNLSPTFVSSDTSSSSSFNVGCLRSGKPYNSGSDRGVSREPLIPNPPAKSRLTPAAHPKPAASPSLPHAALASCSRFINSSGPVLLDRPSPVSSLIISEPSSASIQDCLLSCWSRRCAAVSLLLFVEDASRTADRAQSRVEVAGIEAGAERVEGGRHRQRHRVKEAQHHARTRARGRDGSIQQLTARAAVPNRPARGAAGGSNSFARTAGGSGASMSGRFNLTAGVRAVGFGRVRPADGRRRQLRRRRRGGSFVFVAQRRPSPFWSPRGAAAGRPLDEMRRHPRGNSGSQQGRAGCCSWCRGCAELPPRHHLHHHPALLAAAVAAGDAAAVEAVAGGAAAPSGVRSGRDRRAASLKPPPAPAAPRRPPAAAGAGEAASPVQLSAGPYRRLRHQCSVSDLLARPASAAPPASVVAVSRGLAGVVEARVAVGAAEAGILNKRSGVASVGA